MTYIFFFSILLELLQLFLEKKSEAYLMILGDHPLPSATHLAGDARIFLEDDPPIHKSCTTKCWIHSKKI